MSTLLQTLFARRRLAHHTVHGQQLRMIDAHRVPDQRRPARLHQIVLGQRAAPRMAQLPALLAVPDFALFADDGRHARLRFAHLTAQRFALAKPIDDRFHRSIGGQIASARFVEEDDFPARGTRQREDGRSAGRREQQTLEVGRASVRSGPGVAADDARVRFADNADLIRLVLVGGDALGGTGTAGAAVSGRGGGRMVVVVMVLVVLVVLRGLGRMLVLQHVMGLLVDLSLSDYGRGGRGHLTVYRTGHAQSMVAGQEHWIGKQLLAHGTAQFVLHARRCSVPGLLVGDIYGGRGLVCGRSRVI